MREIAKLGATLAVVCALSAGTLTAVHSVVSPRIEENNRVDAERKRLEVLPDAVSFEELERDGRRVHIGRDGAGAPVGAVLTAAPRGYAGPIRMTIGVAPDGSVRGLAISKLDQSETPGLGVKVTLPSFRDQFRGLMAAQVGLKKDGGTIDAITASTISSRAVVIGVRESLEWYAKAFPSGLPAAGEAR